MNRDAMAQTLGFPDYASADPAAKAAIDAMVGSPGPGNQSAAAPSPPEPAEVPLRGPPPGGLFTAMGEKEAFEAPKKGGGAAAPAAPSGPSGLQLSREDALKLPGAHITDVGNISTRAGPNGSVLEFKPQITGQYLAGTFTGPLGPTGIPGFVEYGGPLGSAPAATKAASTSKAGGSGGSSTARSPAEPGLATGLSRNDVLALSGARERTSASGNKYIEAKAGPNGSSLVFFPNAQGNYDPFFSNRATGKLEEFKGELPKASERAGPQGQGQPQTPSLPPQQRVGSLDPRFASGFQSDKSGVPVFNRADQPGQLAPVPGTLGTINPQFQGQLGDRNVGIGINPFAIAAARGEIPNHLIVREPTSTPAQQTMGGYGLNDPFEQARLAGLLTGPVSSVGYANRPGEVYVGAGGPLSAVRSSPSSSAVPLAVEERRAAEQLANILGGGYGGFTQAVSPAYQEGTMGGGVDSSIGGDPYMSGFAAGGSLTLNHPATIVDNATGQPLASLAEVRPERMFDRGGSVTIQNHVAGTDRYAGIDRYNYGPTHPYQPPMDPQAVVDAIRTRNTRGFGLNPITHAIARAEATGAMHAPGISQMFRFADGGTITQPNPYQSEGTAVPQDGSFGVKKGVGSSVIPGATFGPNPGTSGLPDVSSTPPATSPPVTPPATPPTVTSTIDFGPPPTTPPATSPTGVPPVTPPATGGFNYSAFPTLPTIGSLPTPPNLNPYLSPQGMDPYTAYMKQLADYQSGLQGQNATFQGQLAQQQLEAEKNVLEQMKGLNALQGQYGAGLEGLRSGANDPLAAEKVAAQQHLRDTYDPYYGKAGMHTPTEIQPPVMVSGQAQLPSLGVGLRYALLDPMQQYKQAVDWYNLQRQPLETAVSLANQYSNVLGNTGSAFSKQVNASIAQAQAQSDVYAKILAQLQAQPGYWNPGLLTPTNPWNNQPNPNPGADPSMGGYNPNATFLGDAF